MRKPLVATKVTVYTASGSLQGKGSADEVITPTSVTIKNGTLSLTPTAVVCILRAWIATPAERVDLVCKVAFVQRRSVVALDDRRYSGRPAPAGGESLCERGDRRRSKICDG